MKILKFLRIQPRYALGGTTSFNIKKHAFVFGQNIVLMNSNVLIESNSIVHKREIYNQRSRTKKV